MKRLTAAALALVGAIAQPLTGQAQPLKAHDIQGLTLGMTVSQVRAWAGVPIEDLGRMQGQFTKNDDRFDIGFTPLGRLYRIDMDRNLGHFAPTALFLQQLRMKLSSKYGEPNGGLNLQPPFWWKTDEAVLYPDGQRHRLEAEGLSAVVEGGFGFPVKLHLKLMSMHLLRADNSRLNAGPEQSAQDRLTF